MKELILYYDFEKNYIDEIMHIVEGINSICPQKVIVLPNTCQLKKMTDEEVIFVKDLINNIYNERGLGDKE